MGYWDFPICREAFATGQKDSRPHIEGGCFYRLRGRTRNSWTLLTFDSIVEAEEQLRFRRRRGDRIKALNYTSLAPRDHVRGPTEWWAPRGHATIADRDDKGARELRRAVASAEVTREPPREDALRVFEEWTQWARTRHFMVFTGHYRRWLDIHYEVPAATSLVGIIIAGRLEGIFGFERLGDLAQVTIAKHTSRCPVRALWGLGLESIGDTPTLCGSTADVLKEDMGLEPMTSWSFNLKNL
jgi:hypothetical protein